MDNKRMRVLWLSIVGTNEFDQPTKEYLDSAKAEGTDIEVASFPWGPHHVEFHSYESIMLPAITGTVFHNRDYYDSFIIGCFYDPGLEEAREVSGSAIVVAPCEAALAVAPSLGNTFSVIVGRRKWIPRMKENALKYRPAAQLASFRSLDLGVLDFHADEDCTKQRMIEEGRKAIEEDGAEVIVLGCTATFGFYEEMQAALGVPVLDPVITPLKYAEFLVDLRDRFGWGHSRAGLYEPPKPEEYGVWGVFDKGPPPPYRRGN
jgi:allantoin racemase